MKPLIVSSRASNVYAIIIIISSIISSIILRLISSIILSRLQLRPLVLSTPQPIVCWRRLAWRFLWTPGNQGRPVSYTSAFQC